jgi:hypothetical protein
MIKKIYLSLAAIAIFLVPVKTALAVCPVCTVAVIGGVGLSRYLGVDDAITGLWIGGLAVSMVLWTIDWMNRKSIKFPFRKLVIWAGYYLIIVVPLFTTGIVGHPLNKLWGIDKLLLGIIFGSFGLLAGTEAYPKVKEKNGGKSHFPFEKIAFAVSPLAILSLIFYFIIKL